MAARFGRTRRGSQARRRRPAATVKQALPYEYVQTHISRLTSFDSLADDAMFREAIIDNSADFSNVLLRVRKVKLEWSLIQQTGADTILKLAVTRHPEGSPATDLNETSIRDLRNENKLLRGPWMLALRNSPVSPVANMKSITLKNLTLDQNDDLSLHFQNMAGSAIQSAGPHLYMLKKMWVRRLS